MNPQIPDFDRMDRVPVGISRPQLKSQTPFVEQRVAKVLIDIWNARGQADRQMIDGSLRSQMGGVVAGLCVNNLQRAIASLDVASQRSG